MSAEFLFVYGTLRCGSGAETARQLFRRSDFLGFGVCAGEMFLVEDYPGLVDSNDPDALAQGEVYILREPNDLLPILDRYEGIGPEFPDPTEYTRERRQIALAKGGVVTAWVYIYRHSTSGLQRIHSGDFVAYLKAEY